MVAGVVEGFDQRKYTSQTWISFVPVNLPTGELWALKPRELRWVQGLSGFLAGNTRCQVRDRNSSLHIFQAWVGADSIVQFSSVCIA